jgi:hypothetical protein
MKTKKVCEVVYRPLKHFVGCDDTNWYTRCGNGLVSNRSNMRELYNFCPMCGLPFKVVKEFTVPLGIDEVWRGVTGRVKGKKDE